LVSQRTGTMDYEVKGMRGLMQSGAEHCETAVTRRTLRGSFVEPEHGVEVVQVEFPSSLLLPANAMAAETTDP